jgi:hypothetical protein
LQDLRQTCRTLEEKNQQNDIAGIPGQRRLALYINNGRQITIFHGMKLGRKKNFTHPVWRAFLTRAKYRAFLTRAKVSRVFNACQKNR